MISVIARPPKVVEALCIKTIHSSQCVNSRSEFKISVVRQPDCGACPEQREGSRQSSEVVIVCFVTTFLATATLLAMTIPLFFLAGCSIAQSAIKVDYYQLDYQLPSVQNTQAMDVVLGVRRFGIAAAYDHDRLVQREKDLRITQSYYHRWVNNPRMMLSDLVLRDLSKSGNYKAVVLLPSDVAVDYEINGFVQEIVVDDSGKQPHVILSLDVTLLGTPARKDMSRVIFQKSYVSEVPCPNKSPAAIAEAMSSATKDISARLQQDIHGGIAGTIS